MAENRQRAWKEIVLPSQGRFYRSGVPGETEIPEGKIQISKFSFDDQATLASQGMDQMDRSARIIENCCRLPAGFRAGRLLATDRLAILLLTRVITFGPNYSFSFRCRFCGNSQTQKTIDMARDLEDITPDRLTDTLAAFGEVVEEPWSVQLKSAGKTVKLRYLRGDDEADIYRRTKRSVSIPGQAPAAASMAIQFAKRIVAIEDTELTDSRSEVTKEQFIRSLDADDLRRIEISTERHDTGTDTTVYCTCGGCGSENKLEMPMDEEFFRPTSL